MRSENSLHRFFFPSVLRRRLETLAEVVAFVFAGNEWAACGPMIACDCSDSPGPTNKNQSIIWAVEEGRSISQGVRYRPGDFRGLTGHFEGCFAFHRRKTIRQAACIVTWPVPSLSRVKQAPCALDNSLRPGFASISLPCQSRAGPMEG